MSLMNLGSAFLLTVCWLPIGLYYSISDDIYYSVNNLLKEKLSEDVYVNLEE